VTAELFLCLTAGCFRLSCGLCGSCGRLRLLFLRHTATASWQVHRTVVFSPLRRITTVSKPSQSPQGALNFGPFLPTSTSWGRVAGTEMEVP
jgi:hypothetical protein